MIISYANVRGKAKNTSYPNKIDVHSVEDMKKAAMFDHVSGEFADAFNSRGNFIKGYRSNKTFEKSDTLTVDCDNCHANPLLPDIPASEWKTPADVRAVFTNVKFYVVYSRNHMKEKGGKPARPKFHVYFPLSRAVDDWKQYNALKKKVWEAFPAFDDKALDSAHFFFGVENPVAEYYDGTLTIDEFLEQKTTEIPEGARNSTMSHTAGILLKKYGDTDGKAYEAFLRQSERCVPPLSDEELGTIWASAIRFYRNTIKSDPNYIPPETYNTMEFADSLIPDDYTDVGQAKAYISENVDKAIYVKGLGFLFYDGKVWREKEELVQRDLQKFTDRQLALAWKMKNEAETEEDEEKAEKFMKFVLGRRKSSNIRATMAEIKPMILTDISLLDADGMLINTPAGTVDMRTGKMHAHDPKDYCTKITAAAPSDEGMAEWLAFIDKFTVGDKALAEYLQIESGMEAVGEVKLENAVIEVGPGGNGKSTFNNSKFYVLGDYAGTMSAEILTMSYKKSNKGPEYAELRGKRLVIAAELQEGTRLDTAALKNICSTDQVQAEKKFEPPFNFKPTHTTVLYTNHLPKVGTTDKGTWDRIVVVPLVAQFRNTSGEIKNYADVLFKRCGGAILKWIIEGAKKFIDGEYKIEKPKCVLDAINEYHEENDWLMHFLQECCQTEPKGTVAGRELYEAYRLYCDRVGEYKRGNADFKHAVLEKGFDHRKTKAGMIYCGLTLKDEEFLE